MLGAAGSLFLAPDGPDGTVVLEAPAIRAGVATLLVDGVGATRKASVDFSTCNPTNGVEGTPFKGAGTVATPVDGTAVLDSDIDLGANEEGDALLAAVEGVMWLETMMSVVPEAGDSDVSALLASCKKPPGEKDAVLPGCGATRLQVPSRANKRRLLRFIGSTI